MADEEPRSTQVPEEPSAPGSRRSGRARTAESPLPPKRAPRRQPENAVQAGRAPRRARTPKPRDEPSAALDLATSHPRVPRADEDPWTVPASVRDRFVQEGHRFYFPDGHLAFRDLGRKLTTASENTQVVRSLIEIAQDRGWNEIAVSGTERFREEAWRQGRLAGLNIRGFRPSEEQQAHLVRNLARNLAGGRERTDSVSEGASVPPPPNEGVPSPQGAATERIAGKLLDHGRDTYRHDPDAQPSYFVQLQTPEGRREVWGKDIERAITKSLTQPQIGDEVVLQRTGSEPVTVRRRERDPQGGFRERDLDVSRNRWALETRAFFDARAAAAELVRNEAVSPPQAVKERPELAGTYLTLRAAELAAETLRDAEDRRRFVRQVRRALAEDIQHGEPLTPVRLRSRTRDGSRDAQARPGTAPANPEIERSI